MSGVPGYERLPDPPGDGHVNYTIWNSRVYAARSGCVWVFDGAAWEEIKPMLVDGPVMVEAVLGDERLRWTLADGENMPPGFPPRKDGPDHD
jgi:hypothetical protein